MIGHLVSTGAIPEPVVIAGALPAPIESSRRYGWDSIVVERYSARDVDVITKSPAALVTLHLGQAVAMTQTRCKTSDRRRLTRGDITVTPPDKRKGWRHRGPADFLALWLAPSLVRNAAALAGESHPERVELRYDFGTRDLQIERLGLSLLTELECEGFGGRLYVESLANALAVHLLRRYSTATLGVRTATTVLPSFKLRRATEYINENLGKNVTLSEIAGALAMSPYHFAHVFKQTTGVAPHQYLLNRRIEFAKTLLRDTELSITEVAQRVGCNSPSHFSVLFHRATTMTPRTFRQQR